MSLKERLAAMFNEPELNPMVTLKEMTLNQMSTVSSVLREKNLIKRTPCERTCSNNILFRSIKCYIKLDMLQECGSSIARGAAYAINQYHDSSPIITASMNNFAIALCHYATLRRIPITIIMPKITPSSKILMCKKILFHGHQNSKVIVQGNDLEEAVRFAVATSLNLNMVYIGEDHPTVIQGQTSLGYDILEDMENIDTIVVPISNAAIIAGIAMAVKKKNEKIKIIGVESDACPNFTEVRNSEKKSPSIPIKELALKIGINSFIIANSLIDELIVVKENSIAAAMVHVMEQEGYTVESSGAMGLAAVLYNDYFKNFTEKKLLVVMSDGNLDPSNIEKFVQIGLYMQDRLLEFTVEISNQPQYLENLINSLTKLSILIYKFESFATCIRVICETKDTAHTTLVQQVLNNDYKWSGFCPVQKLY